MKYALTCVVAGILGGYDRYYQPHMMGGWWMWVLWLGGFILLVLMVYLLLSGLRSGGRPVEPPPETPLDIVKKRYAKGEITREQYEQMKKDIES